MSITIRVFFFAALLASGLPPAAGGRLQAQEDPLSRGSTGTGLALRRLDGVKRVLLIGAHPDDEETSLLATLARGLGVETAYLSLTRGEGGQNLLGSELDEGLGLLRTGELLAARTLDGGSQYFTRAFDFGYSKTAEETFRYWPREEILADVTWVVRTFRPHVIVSVFSGTPRDGHGHHQVAGLLAQAVWDVAGDPSAFPEQIREGVTPWTPLKLYRSVRFGPGEGTTELQTGGFDPLLGRSHFQLAMQSRSRHRSQDMGQAQPMGPRTSFLTLLESRVSTGGGPGDSFFAGVDTTLLGLTGSLNGGVRAEVEGALRAYRSRIAAAREGLEATAPWRIAPELDGALDALTRAQGLLGGEEQGELHRVLESRIPILQEAILAARGVVVEVMAARDLLVPGEEVEVELQVWNGGPLPVTRAVAALELPGGWTARLQAGLDGQDIPPGGIRTWRFAVGVSPAAALSRSFFLAEGREGEMYRWPSEPSLWGKAVDPPVMEGRVGVGVGEGPTLLVRRPARFRGVDKAVGEFVKPLLVVPAVSVAVDPETMVWPAHRKEPREISVRVGNVAAGERNGVVRLDLPPGWKAEPESHAVELREAGAEASFTFRVTPPPRLAIGDHAVRARVRLADGREYGEGFSLVDYSHAPRSILFSPSRIRVSALPVSLEPGLRVGYVMGSGDLGATVLRQLGADVTMLGPGTVWGGALQGLDVVVLGIRAYETRPDLAAANQDLLDFARGGGTVIVQYNKYEYPRGGFAPYPVEMARPHDRVSDETVPVTVLEPSHPLFNEPNRITDADFQGWAQERGLYFLSEWDDRYEPLLEMADPGEPPKRGGLLVAPLGEGVYVYTGLSFFRQFPEGVPGAYRIFANLVSLKGEGTSGG